MKLADPLPKTNAPREEEGELAFCSTEEGVKEILQTRPAGKMLFVTDAGALGAFRKGLPPRALCLVLDSEECLPLFCSSDDVSCVAAAGRVDTIVAARFFAHVRKIPCTVFPLSMTFDGAYEKFGEVRFGSKTERVPLKTARVCCDEALSRPSAGQAYMRLLLSRLALVEAKAMRRFGTECGAEEAEERAYSSLLSLKGASLDALSVARKNAELRRCERDGMNRGEGVALARSIGREGEERAFCLLSALYSAFFGYGKPRLSVPDYAARAKRAGAPYAEQRVPTADELFLRGARLNGMRKEIYGELNAFLEGSLHYRNNFYSLAGRAPSEGKELSFLKSLPERTAGLSAIIRDFGLMEWEEVDILQKSV